MRCTRIMAVLACVAVSVSASSDAQQPETQLAPQQAAQVPVPSLPGYKSFKPPQKVKHVEPVYPEDALRAGLRGQVVIQGQIDATGVVTGIKVVKGVPPLTEAAVRAVEKWRFRPLHVDGVPVPVATTFTVDFQRDVKFDLHGLYQSLQSSNEYIREAAATWLGKARGNIQPSARFRVLQELRYLAEHDDSERVRAAAAQAVVQMTPEKQ